MESAESPSTTRSRGLRFNLRALILVLTIVACGLGAFVVRVSSHRAALRRHTAIVDVIRDNTTTLPIQNDFARLAITQRRKESALPPADVDARLAEWGARLKSAHATELEIDFSKTPLAGRPGDVAELLASHYEQGLQSLGLRPVRLLAVGHRIWMADGLVVTIDVTIPSGQKTALVRVLFIDQQGN